MERAHSPAAALIDVILRGSTTALLPPFLLSSPAILEWIVLDDISISAISVEDALKLTADMNTTSIYWI